MPPASTYRVQLGPNLTFSGAAELIPYLRDLGVGAMYTSPVLAAAPGSDHGYDVVDPTRASPALGGQEAFTRLAGALKDAGLGLVADIVPNHMGIAVPAANPAWWDVLRLGRESPYARFFDIDWDRAPIMVPVLAGAGAVADLTIIDGQLAYHDLRFPIAPGTEGGTPHQVHERQHYRLADWRRANSELNYRRFFDVTTLAAVRVEDPEVFEATHATVLGWVAAGQVTGLRVDHPDGLADPGAYLRRLAAEAPSAWLVVEKILGPDEALPARWPVDGTTGYDALRRVCGLFVAGAGEPALTAFADEECGDQDLREMDYTAKWWVAEDILRAEVRRIARVVGRVVPAQQIEPGQAEQAVIELLACFPVYRSYLADGEADALQAAAAEATRWSPELAGPIEALVRQMTGDRDGELAERVQQTAAMVMAKGEEDTVFYRYNRFISLNEVGGDPGRFGVPPEEFHHRAGRAAAGDHPHSMTTLSTHDTKRSEDVRARLAVLSEVPGEFTDAVRRWSARAGLRSPRSTCSRGSHWSARGPSPRNGWPGTWKRRRARPRSRPAGSSPTRSSTRPWPPGRRRCSRTGNWPRTWPASSRWCARPAGQTRWARSSFSSPCPACPTSTRAANCGTCRWSTRTIAVRSTSPSAGNCWRASTLAGSPTWTSPARPSCWW